MSTITDEDLVARCKRELPGDTRSFELLVQRHVHRVYSLSYRVVGNKEEAEDVTQEVFTKVYNNLRKFEQQAAFSTWLYRVATNSALDALDKTKRRPKNAFHLKKHPTDSSSSEGEVDITELPASSAAGPEEAAIRSELRECINRVLKKLEREQARMLLMRDFEDMHYDEIASLLQVSLSAVKMRIHRARLAFQEVFKQFCGKLYLQ